MIRKFTVENFYSIRDKVSLNFSIPKNAPKMDAFYENCDGGRYPKVVAVFGHNASGKTNLVKALSFLKYFVVHSSELEKGKDIPVQPYAFCENTESASSYFEIEFNIQDKIYTYSVKLTRDAVLEESLKCKTLLFKRNGKKITSKLNTIKKLNGIISPTSSILSFCYKNDLDEPELDGVIAAFVNATSNVTSIGRHNLTHPLLKQVYSMTKPYDAFPTIKTKAIELLSAYDLGLSDIRFEKQIAFNSSTNESKEQLIPMAYHKINGVEQPLSIAQESNGTQSLYVILFDILHTLESGSVAVIDEIDAYLHSHMLKNFLELFYDEESNPHGAQLIFTGHADYIMSYLEKEQIILTEKDEDCVTDAYFIKDIKGVRRVDNLREKYHAGAYGGIPVEA